MIYGKNSISDVLAANGIVVSYQTISNKGNVDRQ
jgi:hypothetical protein